MTIAKGDPNIIIDIMHYNIDIIDDDCKTLSQSESIRVSWLIPIYG